MISFAEFKTKRRDTEMVDTPLSFADFKSKETKTEIPTKIDLNFTVPSFNTQTSTPAIIKEGTLTPQMLLSEAGKGIARGYAVTGQKIVSDIGQRFYKLEPNELVDPDTFFGTSETASKIGRKIFGKDVPFSATTEDVELLEMFGVDKETATGTGGSLTLLLTATDLFGGGVKGIAGATRAIKGVNKVDDAIKLAKNMGFADDIATQYADVFVKAKTTKEAKNALEAAVKLQNTTKLPTEVAQSTLDFGAFKAQKMEDSLLSEARKYKSAEEFVKAQNKTATGAKVPDTLKVYALDDKDLGQIYRQSGLKSSSYPADFVAKNDIPKLKIQRGDKVSILANDKDAKRFTIENIPERKTESGTYSRSAQVGDLVEGYSRQDQIDFINTNFSKESLTKSQLTDIWNKANLATKEVAYKGETDLTTKILKDLEGKTTVSKQYILDATNRGELKQVERDLIRQALEGEKDVVNVADFANKVKAELLPLNVKTTSNPKGSDPKFFREQTRGDAQYGGARMQPRYEMVNLPDELRGNVKNYRENIYESPIKTSAGETHFGGKSDSYFGHTRIEDMADNQTRRVIEVQSDLHQRGRLQQEFDTITSALHEKVIRPEILNEMKKLYPKITAKDVGDFIKNCL